MSTPPAQRETRTDDRPPFGLGWTLHGDGRPPAHGEVVRPGERLSWDRTVGLGMQHVVAMFGATFLVPLLTGLPPATTLFFSGVGTMLFLLITAGRVPSYLGSSFAFIAPLTAATASHDLPTALGGVVMAGLALALVGVVVHLAGDRWLRALMPPMVTGTIVALIGLNLAPAAKNNFVVSPVTATVTLVVILVLTVLSKGMISRLAILGGVAAGYATAAVRGELDFSKVETAAYVGIPSFTAPSFDIGIADYTWEIGDIQLAGIALGTAAALIGFHGMRALNRVTDAVPDPLIPLRD